MSWRAMGSLLVLRDQVNAIAPDRSKASDGLVGDADHQSTASDHNPHFVARVGAEIVTALDLTHDPAGGFDSYRFADVLRTHRDRRIKYVISNRRIFSSYWSGGVAPFTWRTYEGNDPHINHVHLSVLDDPISDTATPWNLEGLAMTQTEFNNLFSTALKDPAIAAQMRAIAWQYADANADAYDIMLKPGPDGVLRGSLAALLAGVAEIKEAIAELPAAGTGDGAAPTGGNVSGTFSGSITLT